MVEGIIAGTLLFMVGLVVGGWVTWAFVDDILENLHQVIRKERAAARRYEQAALMWKRLAQAKAVKVGAVTTSTAVKLREVK